MSITIKSMAAGFVATMFMLFAPLQMAEAGDINPQPRDDGSFDFNGSVGIVSDYFFRGVSQSNGQLAKQLTGEVSGKGFYGGFWASEVEGLAPEADLEYDLYGGYRLTISDQFSVDTGVIQYRYDGDSIDKTDEWYVSGTYGPVSIGHYRNLDDSDMTYSEVEIALAFIPVVDTSIRYGSVERGESYIQINGTRVINDNFSINFELVDLQEARDPGPDEDFSDFVSIGVSYSF